MKTKLPMLPWLVLCWLLLLCSLTAARADLPVQLVGGYDTGHYACGVAVSGNYAYVADTYDDLQIIDVSNPASPVRVGGYLLGSAAYGVAISGNYAYVAEAYDGLQVINISNPAAPIWMGGCDTSGCACGVAVSGNYAYVADEAAGLQVIDISNPASPIGIGRCDTSGYATGVAVSGSYAYVADGSSGLQVINISNPSSPTCIGGYNTTGSANRLTLSGKYSYVADWTSGLQVIDISHPAAPIRVGGYDTTGSAREVVISGDYAFVADWTSGVQVVDMSNPASPIRVGGRTTGDRALGIVVSGNYVYVADGYAGLAILHADTAAMQISSITPAAGANSGSIGITDLSGFRFQPGATARLSRPGETDIVATGVAVVSMMKITCTFDLTGAEPGLWNVVVANPDGESATLTDGFTVAGTVAAQLVGGCSTGGDADSVAVSGDYAYVVNRNAGLKVIDVSTPAAPTVVGNYAMTSTGYGVSIFGDCVYVAKGQGWAGWRSIDVSSPAAPSLVQDYWHYVPPHCPEDACYCDNEVYGPTTIWGNCARMYHRWGGCAGGFCQYCDTVHETVFVALSGAACPTQGDTCSSEVGYGNEVSGNHRYVADGAAGLQVLDTSIPAFPVRVGGYDTSGDARDVAVSGGYAYVADGPGGLVILQVAAFPAPTIGAITPNSSPNGEALSVMDLAGTGFLSGATVRLTRAGETDIPATGATVVNSTQITCAFNLTGKALGQWNVVVTNVDRQSGTLDGGLTITDGFIPVIRSVSVIPQMVARGEGVHAAVGVTDNVGVTSVTVNGTALTNTDGSTWSGDIPADGTLGLHYMTVIARDAAGNSSTDARLSYRTARVLGITNRDLAAYVSPGSAGTYLFSATGRVTRLDANTFELRDGSATPVRVSYPEHGLQTGEYATAHGIWSLTGSPHTLNASRVTKLP